MKTYEKKGYRLHIIKDASFKTVSFKMMIYNKLKKEDLAYRNMLFSNLLFTSKNYPTIKDMGSKRLDLYNTDIYYTTSRRGLLVINELSMSVINDKYSEKNNFINSLEFLSDLINNPHVKDNKWNKKSFDICLEGLKSDIKNEIENPDYICYKEYKSLLKNKNIYSGSILGDLSDYKKITRENLYTYYKKFWKNNNIDIFIVGDINEEEISNKMDEYFSFNSIYKNFDYEIAYEKEFSFKEKAYPFSQSKFIMGSTLKNLTSYEKKYVMPIYNIILGSGPTSKLFSNVREKLSLCYSISSSSSRLDNMFMIRSGISYKNYDLAKNEVLKQMDFMKKGDFSLKSIKEAKSFILSTIEDLTDFPFAIIDHSFSSLYFETDDLSIQKEKITNVSKEEVIKLAKKIKIDTIFLLKGDKNE